MKRSRIENEPGIEVFFSYAHTSRDERLRDEIEKHIVPLKYTNLVRSWHDRSISPGREFAVEIRSHMESADLILLLVSADFLSSAYCYTIEMKRAIERHKRGEARVIPIILRPCLWHHTPLGELLTLPTDGKPVVLWPKREVALLNVANGIRQAVQELYEAKITSLAGKR